MDAVNLEYDLIAALHAGVKGHAQAVMRELGITYLHATPQSMADQWWFWGCAHVPTPLPPYLSPLTVSVHDAIGYGLSEADAARITGQAPA